MFKSRKRNPKLKGALRRKQEDTAEDDNEDEKEGTSKTGGNTVDDNDSSTAATIARVKKKRKLLTELQYKKGTDAASLLKGPSGHPHDDHDNDLSNENTLAAETAAASSSQEGIMEQKHKQALEQYVEAKLADMVGGDAKVAVTNAQAKSHQNNDTTSNNKALTKEELYRQLAEASDNMVGKKESEGGAHHADGGEDGDVGTGGAMLVAGTGLAEVILPVEERLKAVHATQEAAVAGPRSDKQQHNMNYGMPQSKVPVPAGTSRFAVSAAAQHRHFAPHQNNSNTNNNTSGGAPQPTSNADQPFNEVDQGRMGFEAARGKATATADNNNSNYKGNHNNNQHGGANSNSNAGKKDYKNKASDDKVYGNFLKHHRENQWRGR